MSIEELLTIKEGDFIYNTFDNKKWKVFSVDKSYFRIIVGISMPSIIVSHWDTNWSLRGVNL